MNETYFTEIIGGGRMKSYLSLHEAAEAFTSGFQ